MSVAVWPIGEVVVASFPGADPVAARALLDGMGWLGDLSAADRGALASLLTPRAVAAGEAVLVEGQASDRLYLVGGGRLAVQKRSSHDVPTAIAELRAGDAFGDLSFLDEEPASASVVAEEAGVVWSLARGDLAGRPGLARRVEAAIVRLAPRRLRRQNEALVASLERQLSAERLRTEAASLLGLVIVLFGLQQAVRGVVAELGLGLDSLAWRWGMLLVFMAPTLLFARTSGFSWADLGFTLADARRCLRESLAVSAIGLAAIGAGALAASELGRAPAGGGFLSAPQEWLEYLAHATIQEIGARGIIQSAIVRFLGPDRVVEALLLVSATFGVVHMHLGLGVAALTAVASLAFSALYHRHGSLVGVVLVHFLLGGALKALGVM